MLLDRAVFDDLVDPGAFDRVIRGFVDGYGQPAARDKTQSKS